MWGPKVEIRVETQLNPVADEVAALIAVVRPILEGTLYALKRDVVQEVGGFEQITLKLLPRLYRQGDGDCGICFEYAVHDAVMRGEPSVMQRVEESVTRLCNVPGASLASILFGAEKTGSRQLIATAHEILTDDSVLLYGTQGRPVKLKRHLATIASAMKRPTARERLPRSITGLWKADLFLGHDDADRWVGTTVKINERQLEGAKGLRVGIVPVKQGENDMPRKDDRRNLVVCPLPHDGAFVEKFYQGWIIVQQFIAADGRVPSEAAIPRPPERQVAKILADRRDYPVVDVIEALKPIAQPELLATSPRDAQLTIVGGDDEVDTGALVSPVASLIE